MPRRMDPEKQEVLERQGYRIVGEHSGVKLCHWTKASLTKGVGCYKQTFYGIESHRCLQMTPAVDACNLACQFCWRTQEWGSNSLLAADDPAFIVDESIRGQRELLTGFKGNPNVSRERFLEAWHPPTVALSLTGEPTLYNRLGKPMFIECKGYSFVGESRLRLQAENVPSHASIRTFAERLADRLGYRIAAEREDSRVVLLTQDGALHPIFQ